MNSISLLLMISILSFTFEETAFLQRYWNCCKPDCSSPDNSDGNPARICDAGMNTLNDPNEKDICEGGPATMCLDQNPIVVNDSLAYAFVDAHGNVCGKCYELIFTGEGMLRPELSYMKIAGKRLIVMAISNGAPEGHFRLLIPGGGIEVLNGCSKVLGTKIGKRSGGLLKECRKEISFDGELDEETKYIKTQSCLINKCKKFFSENIQALEGCLFLANWLETADAPEFVYEEVDCPKELLSKY